MAARMGEERGTVVPTSREESERSERGRREENEVREKRMGLVDVVLGQNFVCVAWKSSALSTIARSAKNAFLAANRRIRDIDTLS